MRIAVTRRIGQYPVRLSLNISEYMAQQLARWAHITGERRGTIARRALKAGLPVLAEERRQKMQEAVAGEPPAGVPHVASVPHSPSGPPSGDGDPPSDDDARP